MVLVECLFDMIYVVMTMLEIEEIDPKDFHLLVIDTFPGPRVH